MQLNRTPPEDGWGNWADTIFAWASGWAPFFGAMLVFAIVAAAFMTISQTRLFRKQDSQKAVAAEIVRWADVATAFLEKVIGQLGASDPSPLFPLEELLELLLHLGSLMVRTDDSDLSTSGQSTREAMMQLFDASSEKTSLSTAVARAKVQVMELRRHAIERR